MTRTLFALAFFTSLILPGLCAVLCFLTAASGKQFSVSIGLLGIRNRNYFHNFWAIADAKAQQEQMIHFMKNLSIMGAMLFIIANGPGPMSIISVKQK